MYIETNRLSIRNMMPEDWQGLRNIASDFAQSRYAVYDHPMPTEDREIQQLTKIFSESGLWYAVFLPDSAEMIGYVCFHEDQSSYDLGYCFHSKAQGKGYAFESCTALMQYLEENREVKRFTSGTALKNTPSRKLLEKLGFVLVGTEQVSFYKDADGNDILFEGGNYIR